jgi:hypothetical protein
MVVILSRGLPMGNKRTHGFASKAMSQKTFRGAPSLGFSMNMNHVATLTRQSLGVNATPDKVRCEVSSRLRPVFRLAPPPSGSVPKLHLLKHLGSILNASWGIWKYLGGILVNLEVLQVFHWGSNWASPSGRLALELDLLLRACHYAAQEGYCSPRIQKICRPQCGAD